jgi:hypothetical protein
MSHRKEREIWEQKEKENECPNHSCVDHDREEWEGQACGEGKEGG